MKRNFNWNEIKTKGGFAGHIPDAIEMLNSAIEEDRRGAYWKIDNYAIVQSDLYEAAYYVIEPVVELLEEPYSVERTYPLRLLAEISLGGYYEEDQITVDGKSINLHTACQDKLRELKTRIQNIEVRKENEQKEKNDILENI